MHAYLFRTSHFQRAVVSLVTALALSSCGNKDASPIASQVAAKVGSEEISVHQINQALTQSNTANASAQEVATMGRVVLEKLIDQQLAVEQAMDAKLNRSPDTVTQLETARREILAGAYIKQVASGVPRPSADETRKYFTEHPQLFAQRRIFSVQEILVGTNAEASAQLHSLVSTGKPMEQIAAWLKEKNIPFSGGTATRAAEQIPMEILGKVNALTDGQTTVIDTPASITVLHLISSQSAPVPDTAALPRIAQFLLNQRVNAAVATNLQHLRTVSKITYVGEFAQPAKPAASEPIVALAPVAANGDARRAAIDKGLAGLK
jgi:EpsD family peptidyl-prolyl cis-trans isomerase